MINILIISISIFFSSEQDATYYLKKANKLMKTCGDRKEIGNLATIGGSILENKEKKNITITKEEIFEIDLFRNRYETYKKNCLK
jgi:hypothetical protein